MISRLGIAARSLLFLPVLLVLPTLGCTWQSSNTNSSSSNTPNNSTTNNSGTPIANAVSQGSFTYQGVTYPYLVFTPSAFGTGQRLPVLLLVHGFGGKGQDMLSLWQTFANQQGIILVAPTFPLGQQFEALVPGLYPRLMDSIKPARGFDPHRVYVFGYSAGGYTSFEAATEASTYFASAGVFAAIITPDYYWIVTSAQRKTPIALYIGDHDQFFTLDQTRSTRDELVSNGFTVHYVELTNQDHNYGAVADKVNADAWRFMSQYTLP